MNRHLIGSFIAIALLATACASDGGGTAAVSGDTDEVELSGGDAITTSVPPIGPTTTFVPALEGPFDLGGGASRGDDSTVIVDSNGFAGVSSALARYTNWETDWTRRTVEDWEEFQPGLASSDPRDGIPPLDRPMFESAALAAQWLGPREPGALVQFNGETRFYPLGILTRHEVVNDVFGDIPVAVTFCPLCNTAVAFDRRVDGEALRFGVSGLLRNSDLVMWDSATTSLWQQITGEGVVGEYAGTQLEIIPTSIVSFEQFAAEFADDGKSLAAESGFGRTQYGLNPYAGYSSSDRPFLFAGSTDDRLPALSRVVGLFDTDPLRAYSFDSVAEAGVVNDVVGEDPITIFWGGRTADALDQQAIGNSEEIGTAVVFDPVVDGRTLTFTPGSIPDTFVDDQTGSTWSILGLATDGELAGTRLDVFPHRNEFWFAWQAFFGPDSLFEL